MNTSKGTVRLLERFVQRGKHKQSQRLFCRVRYVKGRYMLSESPLSYSRALELFRDLLRKIHLDAKSFGLHIPRSGGATEAARSQSAWPCLAPTWRLEKRQSRGWLRSRVFAQFPDCYQESWTVTLAS